MIVYKALQSHSKRKRPYLYFIPGELEQNRIS